MEALTESLAAREKEDAAAEKQEADEAATTAAASASTTAVAQADGRPAPFVETTEEIGSPDLFTDALKLVASATGTEKGRNSTFVI